ncbi:hypothetical protein nbrc107697_29390 [Gordonia crocea]|uniref:N-acetyltransferase n=1 Tax=Gordonia crocea TaxID=589162 RepID=A0A7I9V1F2_9ACTN|nr:hypothetical protein nbrc107697_29390 [Gordonia crocea]
MDVSATAGRSAVVTSIATPIDAGPEHPYLRFAAKHGFTVAAPSVARHLELPVDTDRLSDLFDESRRRWDDRYTVSTHLGAVPEERQQPLCELMGMLEAEAPTGAVELEPMRITPADYRQDIANATQRGSLRVTTLAVERRSGRLAGYTEITGPSRGGRRAHQGGTLVLADHRGHSLGIALKTANIREFALLTDRPCLLTTTNADMNAPMVAINDLLGFRAVESRPLLQRLNT